MTPSPRPSSSVRSSSAPLIVLSEGGGVGGSRRSGRCSSQEQSDSTASNSTNGSNNSTGVGVTRRSSRSRTVRRTGCSDARVCASRGPATAISGQQSAANNIGQPNTGLGVNNEGFITVTGRKRKAAGPSVKDPSPIPSSSSSSSSSSNHGRGILAASSSSLAEMLSSSAKQALRHQRLIDVCSLPRSEAQRVVQQLAPGLASVFAALSSSDQKIQLADIIMAEVEQPRSRTQFVGLDNPSNTLCYLNSALQILLSVPGFSKSLLDFHCKVVKLHMSGLNGQTPEADPPTMPLTKVIIDLAFTLGVLKLSRSPDGLTLPSIASPAAVKAVLDNVSGAFKKKKQQQDAEECLAIILDILQDELLDAASLANMAVGEEGLPTDEFSFVIGNTLTCLECGKSR